MNKNQNADIEDKLKEVMDSINAIGPVLVGNILTNRNKKIRKDGSEYISKPNYTFQYNNSEGKRAWKRIPRDILGDFKKLVENGKEYMRLQKLCTSLITQLALSDVKKNDVSD